MKGEIACFKVFPKRPHYWTVLVFEHKGYMRRAFHQLNISDDIDDRFGAIVMPQEIWHCTRGEWHIVSPSLGHVLFARTQLCMETQCHEAVHMALGYLRRIGHCPHLGKETDDAEETLAYYTGRCAAQLNRGFHKFHCYRS